MKELCLRLIKDGKIVGYESITGGLRVQMHGDKPFDTPDNIAFDGFIFHDSFDMGIKVGDEWWFENDIIKYIMGDSGVLSHGEYYIQACKVDAVDSALYFGWHVLSNRGNTVEPFEYMGNCTKIGTIYDKGEK